MGEARLVETNNVLVALSGLEDEGLLERFLGSVVVVPERATALPELSRKSVYVCGDLSRLGELELAGAARVFAVRELSRGLEGVTFPVVGLGRLPLRVHGVGAYYRRFFEADEQLFQRLSAEHTFQSLTESVKPGKAHRTGIYLTPVRREGDELHFHLLRCSTNLSGPSENFARHDRRIVDALNQEASFIFEEQARLNHVLAQLYRNAPAPSVGQKQIKAKISAHADKTKDMPRSGIMAFCTFYDEFARLSPLDKDSFDYGYKGKSGLTRLQFRLKDGGAARAGLPAEFTLTLHPDSVFFMPLSTNRLYTHELQSSILNAELLPTRLGYVVRCSKTEAVHKNGVTFLKLASGRVPLEQPTPQGMDELRRLYAEENQSASFIDYGDRFSFSMNAGDYLAPALEDD
ncbi:MAG: hypothetical protein QM756_04610 [Polyangiaceae bacterium]